MKRITPVLIAAAVFLVAGISAAEFNDLGFVAELQSIPGSERNLLQVEDIYKLITNGMPNENYLIDFAPETTSDTEFDLEDLFLVEIIGQTTEDLIEYYETRGTPSPFLEYLIAAAEGEAPFVLLNTSGENADETFQTSLLDGAKFFLLSIEEQFTVPADYPCGIYVAATKDESVTLTFEVDGAQCLQTVGYEIKDKSKKKFKKRLVHLRDQFDELMESDGADYEVKKPKELYNITAIDFDFVNDAPVFGPPGIPAIHWVGYEIKLGKKQRKDGEVKNIQVVPTKFGEIFVDTKKPKLLMVPAFKDLEEPISAKPLAEAADHYKCYDVKTSKGFKFGEDFPFVVVDQFNRDGVLLKVKKPKRLCVPVEKTVITEDGTEMKYPINLPDIHLICYDSEKKIEKIKGIHTTDQFGQLEVETKKLKRLCVTAEKIFPDEDDNGSR